LRPGLQGAPAEMVDAILERRGELEERLGTMRRLAPSGARTRTHGDFHLGQVLVAQGDVFLIDFEGEPARPLEERREKQSPLRDVAGMLRSFDYAVHMALAAQGGGSSPTAGRAPLDAWADAWEREMRELFLGAYLDEVGNAPFVPRDREQLDRVLAVFELEKAVYELGYELNNRPDWIWLPVRGILKILGEDV
jgi:maltose alpha-D-glucosyltransferase / alpha-amylase